MKERLVKITPKCQNVSATGWILCRGGGSVDISKPTKVKFCRAETPPSPRKTSHGEHDNVETLLTIIDVSMLGIS